MNPETTGSSLKRSMEATYVGAVEEDAKQLIRALAEGVTDPGEPIATARVDVVAASAGLAPSAVGTGRP